MAFLIDTNILLRSVDVNHPMYSDATNAMRILRARGEILHLTPQNMIEFWNVYTRPLERNGLGRSASDADAQLSQLEVLFTLLPDEPAIYPRWRSLVASYGVIGVNVHDAKLVAAMLVHGVSHILTFNIRDFRRYTEIIAVNPSDVSDRV
jgi:predicted nucleic acid-binding protein